MKVFAKQHEAHPVTEHQVSTFYEYPLQFNRCSVGVSYIHGKYPETGVDLDQESEAVWYVISGTGNVVIDHQNYDVEAGDMILVKAGQTYQIIGNHLKLVVVSSPPWKPEQHHHTES